ncbi:asparagine synthetase B family protein [Salegentibacter mishustinae]|uniref:asparagine synthase (glutamine-hydrolyzing) n=1 Tax=Salegentibacter mishustinae TaxID=270918 RepID=A0A0Q9ZDY9_9FLAO|nr:hypothetical protein [Salegentibacter mishustinae]KRG28418.1 hypothetical protein APR42_06455 [Salegentibacter mishustinae]PNW22352.1 hypothetical protein APB85_14220 [Salegentibacter mishustinae]PZX67581.1 glutamine amidotransferase-like protein [Salegentibacter mishustinae]GGW78790.1 hypothetical protein GCM10008086_02980 [Salegentibacter mishustinae]
MKFLISQRSPGKDDFQKLELKYQVEAGTAGPYSIVTEKDTSGYSGQGLRSFIDGYIRDFNCAMPDVASQTENAIGLITKQWPVPNSISGSFSTAIIEEKTGEIVVCNDAIGVYPLYYFAGENEFYISNSLIWLGVVSKASVDEVGLFQRTYCPEFANIGSRTLLKNVKRLLPGEWIRFRKSGEIRERKYDNELYQQLSDSVAPLKYWKAFKKEVSYCLAEEENVHVALSGGMDSRLIMGSVPREKQLFCHTYGQEDYYESLIAKRIAGLYDANFRSYSQPELNFPGKEVLEKYTIETEAIYLNHWLEILEEHEIENRENMLVGDMTESLQGRNLPMKKNWKNFKQYYLGRKEYPLTENTREKFEDWKDGVISKYTGLISQKHLNRINVQLTEEQINNEITADLEELFLRIEQHNLPYLELVSEIFTWFTHSRIPMGKQILILNSNFKSFCVPMSVQILRLTSNLHPNLRLNGRYIKSLFASVKELKLGASEPTSQIPFVPFNSPEIFKVPIWFLRSEIDDFLIKRVMKSGNPKKRYRVLKSFNWVEVYQQPKMEAKLWSYFEKNYLGEGYTNAVIYGALKRRDLEQWPLSNINIINAAALNAELALLKALKDE